MKRRSNLAFNREFPAHSGLPGIPRNNAVRIARDRNNAFDADACGVWLDGVPELPIGWLYRKDNNRPAALEKLDSGGELTGHIELFDGKKVVVFWL
mgnify:CR=1 FL=1|jgi:hypothetical protein